MATTTESETWITAKAAARRLGVRPDRIRYLALAGKLGSRALPFCRTTYRAADVDALAAAAVHPATTGRTN